MIVIHDEDRPNPLKDAATKVGGVWATVGGVVGMLVSLGVVSAAQGQALTSLGDAVSPTLLGVGALVGGIVPLVTGLIAAFRTGASARPKVTPVDDPRILDAVTGELVALVPAGGPFAGDDTLGKHNKEF